MSIEIKRACIVDAEEIVQAKADAFREELAMYKRPSKFNTVQEIDFITNNYSYILKDDNQIIGGIVVTDKENGHYHLGPIFVKLEYQNKGIGSLAMKFIENEFPNTNKWTLETPYLSYRNHHFYEKHGFIKVGETEPDPERNGFYLFLYEKICY